MSLLALILIVIGGCFLITVFFQRHYAKKREEAKKRQEFNPEDFTYCREPIPSIVHALKTRPHTFGIDPRGFPPIDNVCVDNTLAAYDRVTKVVVIIHLQQHNGTYLNSYTTFGELTPHELHMLRDHIRAARAVKKERLDSRREKREEKHRERVANAYKNNTSYLEEVKS